MGSDAVETPRHRILATSQNGWLLVMEESTRDMRDHARWRILARGAARAVDGTAKEDEVVE